MPPSDNSVDVAYLVFLQGIDAQNIKNIPLTALPLPPLPRLHGTQIVRRVHVADLPLRQPRHLPFQILCALELGDVVEGGALGVVDPDGVVSRAVDLLHHVLGEGDAVVAVRVARGVAGDVGGEGRGGGTLGAGRERVVGGGG